MKFIKSFLLIILCVFFVSLTACKNSNEPKNTDKDTTPTVETTDETTTDETTTDETTAGVDWSNVKFDSISVTYDGEVHMPVVEGAPEGATITITPETGRKEPGIYNYTAKIKVDGNNKTMQATLRIEKATPVISAEEHQVAYLTDGVASANCAIDFAEENIEIVKSFYTEAGVYETVITTKETSRFKAAEPVTVTLEVLNSRSGFYLESQTLISDGVNPVTLTLSSTDNTLVLDSKYAVRYTNCQQVLQGQYPVSAEIYYVDTGEVYESFRAILTVDYVDDETFNQYADEMFVYFLEGDQSTNNIFTVNYEDFGLEHYDAVWSSYERYSDEDYQKDVAEVARLKEELASYAELDLSYAQLNTYQTIKEAISYYDALFSNKKNFLMKQSYVDQWGGSCADFPTNLEAYTIRRLEDIEDIISYVDSTYDAFMSYVDYVSDRADAGYGLSEFTLTSMCEYLDGVSEKGMDYYLINILATKIRESQEILELTDSEIQAYVERLEAAFQEKFIPAHADLSASLTAYVKNMKTEGYLSKNFKEGYLQNYTGGKELYVAMLEDRLGLYGVDMDAYITFLDNCFSDYFAGYYSAYLSLDNTAKQIMNGKRKIVDTSDPYVLIEYLKEFASTIVPDLASVPAIDIAYMDETATENTTTLAYYMKSPLDSYSNEYIHLNKQALGEDHLETLSTLAHEGYPGHLYAYVYSKESSSISNITRVMTCTGHGEGWAKYVELALCDYIADTKQNSSWSAAMKCNNYYSLFAYALESRIDVGVNYEGWTLKQVETYLDDNGLNSAIAEDIFQMVIEAPTQIAAYGYGMALVYEWHKTAKAVLGDYYSEVNFNNAILEHGWVSLNALNKYLDTYLVNMSYVYDKQYTSKY